MVFLILLIIPILIAAGFFLLTKKTITWHEFLAHLGIAALVAGMSTGLMYCSNVRDVEVWGGHVTDKKKVKVSCEHDYCCQTCQSCTTDSKGNESCYDYCCQTCYDHPYDFSWRYWTTDAGRSRIPRIDRQGLKEPPRWTKIVVGEPSASSHDFENFIKASPDSLFSKQGLVERYQAKLPAYPGQVYDYYRINRLVTVGTSVEDPKLWNFILMQHNDKLGARKEVAMGVVIVKKQPQEYFSALQQHWLGGKKNDLFLVVSVDDNKDIEWAQVMAWTKDKVAETTVRDAALKVGHVRNAAELLDSMARAVDKDFVRKPMSDFEYLKSSITPTTTQWVISMIINVLLSIGVGIAFHLNDFGEGSFSYRRRRWK